MSRVPGSAFVNASERLGQASFSRPHTYPIDPEILAYHRLHRLIQHHNYVSFRLNKAGEGLHLTKDAAGKLSAVYVSSGSLPDGARMQSLFPLNFGDGGSSAQGNLQQRALGSVLDIVEAKMARRANQPLHIHTSMQGYHEVVRLALGLTDTGGQNAYMRDLNVTEAKNGYRVINVNHGGAGAKHPKSKEVREGMHYDLTSDSGGVDLLFVTTPEGQFVRKESMYDLPGFFENCANQIIHQLKLEPQVVRLIDDFKISNQPHHHVGIFGHYADGGRVAVLLKQQLIQAISAQMAEASSDLVRKVVEPGVIEQLLGAHIITGWFSHSLGATKERDAAGTSNIDRLNLPKRKELEAGIFREIDLIFPTSPSLAESTIQDYGAVPDMNFYPGINSIFFEAFTHRRYEGQPWNARHIETVDFLSQKADPAAGLTPSRLKEAHLIMEISRTAESKGKMLTLQAFHQSLQPESGPVRDRVLIMTMPKPEELLLTLFSEDKDGAVEINRGHVLRYHTIAKHLRNDPEFKAVLAVKKDKLEDEDLAKLQDRLKRAHSDHGNSFWQVWDSADFAKAAEIWRREDFQVALEVEHYLGEHPELKRHIIFQDIWEPTDYARVAEVASIFVTSALSEPWGMSVLEAAAAGLSIIASDRVPSVQTTIKGNVEIVPVGTKPHAAYVQDVAHLIANARPNNQLKGALIKVHNQLLPYTWERVTEGLLNLTKDMFAQNRGKFSPVFSSWVN